MCIKLNWQQYLDGRTYLAKKPRNIEFKKECMYFHLIPFMTQKTFLTTQMRIA